MDDAVYLLLVATSVEIQVVSPNIYDMPTDLFWKLENYGNIKWYFTSQNPICRVSLQGNMNFKILSRLSTD